MGLMDDVRQAFGASSLYEVFELTKTCTSNQIKKAYFKQARKWHPDKADASQRETATTHFQILSRVHAVLSDEEKRKLYDETGAIDDGQLDFGDDFDWEAYWRQLYPKITRESLDNFASKYRHSKEEASDLKKAYLQCQGDIGCIFEHVPLSSVIEDEERFTATINQWIKAGEVEAFPTFVNEPAKKRAKRLRKAEREAREAEVARETLHDDTADAEEPVASPRRAGSSSGARRRRHVGGGTDLAALVQKRQAQRSGSFNAFAAKYGVDLGSVDEPPEEAFQATQRRFDDAKNAKDTAKRQSKSTKSQSKSKKAKGRA